jgi:hypothetical protein
LNGRLQRIAQRLTSLIALLPTALSSLGGLKVAVVEQTLGFTPAAGYGFAGHDRRDGGHRVLGSV